MRRWQDDPFTKKARKENFLARSIYKLDEIDGREKVLSGAKVIVDLGAAPGSWAQYCLKTCSGAKIYAIDLSPLEVEDSRIIFLQISVDDLDAKTFVGGEADVVLSDMAPKTTGMAATDVAASIDLATRALGVADRILKKGGNFVVKVFMGTDFELFQKEMKARFTSVRVHRPESVRKQSREVFLVGKGFKGASTHP